MFSKSSRIAVAVAVTAPLFGASVLTTAGGTPPEGDAAENPMRMWYTEPVAEWTNDALVQGNGTTGLMAFGDPAVERLHFNEKTLWTGGPAEGRDYIGGNMPTAISPEDLENYRQALDDKSEHVFGMEERAANSQLEQLMFGRSGGMGMYQDFGDLYLDFSAAGITTETSENYVRDLDLNTGISTVSFDHEGTHFQREYFVSYPDQVAVVRLLASEPGSLSFTTSASTASGLTTQVSADAQEQKLTVRSTVNDNQMQAELQVQLVNEGGTVTSGSDGTLTVDAADTVTLVYSTGTNYLNEYPTYRGEDPHEKVTQRAETASAAGFDTLLERHLADYQELFFRVNFDVGADVPDIPTDELMANYREGDHDLAVDQLAFQFGRYLSIAGSRLGDLPTNLCGLWLIGSAASFWGADYHFNVNVQMNYWPAMLTNLAETQVPFNEYVESLVVPGRLTAERSAGVATDDFANTPVGEGNGFLINTQVNPFGHTAPIGRQEYGWNIGGSSWAMQNIYDYYRFSGDEDFLREHAYPMLREMATFWNEYLWYSEYQDRLTVAPSVSAEHGPTAVGTAYDQSLVWEVYEMAIEASEILGVDEGMRAQWADKQSQLDPIEIGIQGQVKEWFEETEMGKAQAGELPEENIWGFGAGGSANQGSVHRHTSQLVGLFPGTLISKDTPEWMDASIKSLEQRSLNGTGWSKAMKINMYARTGLADDTYTMVRAMLAGNTNGLLDNLLDSHPPFQIDGNFGLTAGMAEMLVQSQLGYTQFLPALPGAWPTGTVDGLVARGNFVVGMDWEDGQASEFRVTARNGGTFTGDYAGIGAATVRDSEGRIMATTSEEADQITFETVEGESYTINWADPTYAISYDANGATGTVPAAVEGLGWEDTGLHASASGLTREGHSFDGWNTAPDGSGTAVTPSTTYATLAGDDVNVASVTLYAQWSLVPEPSPAPTVTVTAPPVDIYSTPGFHHSNGRAWYTACEPYSQTIRCRTNIWATTVVVDDGRFVQSNGWVFNNLTYLPMMTRAAWADNPLGHEGSWTAEDGRRWKTECDTAATGRNGCRSFAWSSFVASQQDASGAWSHRVTEGWQFNNIVRFKVG